MKALNRIVWTILVILGGNLTHAQDSIPKIEVLAKAGKSNIKLRWAPNSPVAWQRLNTYGYTIERSTITRDGVLLNNVEKRVLTSVPIKPRPLNDWESMADQNDYAAVAAQAIYGETFELSENYSNDIIQVIQKSKEIEQRFSFALFSADQSFEVAELSGLSFIDHTVKEGEKYSYRIKSAVPIDLEEIAFGTVYIGLEDFEQLPRIYDLQAVFGDKSVILSWERLNFEGIYNSFIVEKSIGNPNNFKPITKEPIINTSPSEKLNTRKAYKIDSLSENGQRVYYRVKGINAFGEISPPSDSVFGEGFIRLSGRPEITKWTTDNLKAEIQWEIASEVGLEGFRIGRAPNVDGPYVILDNVSLKTSNYTDKEPMGTNYYRVTAYNSNQEVHSFPVMVQLEDSIPPATPIGLTGKIDTTGVVAINWDKNVEPDLLGYRVYRANFKSAEAIQVTKNAVGNNFYRDSISIDNLTGKIYYQVQAIDKRFNPSGKSVLLELTKPDIVPPVPPVFKYTEAKENGSYMEWLPSSSDDVVSYNLYRRLEGNDWTLISSIESGVNNFLDENIKSGLTYQYTIIALDEAGNESAPIQRVAISNLKSGKGEFTKLNIRITPDGKSIELSWDYKGPEISKIFIYKSQGDEKLSLYKSLSTNSRALIDRTLSKGYNYTYIIQSVDKSNGSILMSDPVTLKY